MSGAASYDLIQPSEYTIEALVKEKQLLPLDQAKIPNLKNIGQGVLGLSRTTRSSKYSVPYMQGTVGIVVNTEKVKEPVTGYGDVFQEKYKGRIVDARRLARDRDLGARDAGHRTRRRDARRTSRRCARCSRSGCRS